MAHSARNAGKGYAISGVTIKIGHGVPSNALRKMIQSVQPHEIRVEDREELHDALSGLGYSDAEIYGAEFGQLLSLALGLEKPKVRVYGIFLVNEVEKVPLFIATLSKQGDGVAVLCGYGLEDGYHYLTQAQILAATKQILSTITYDMRYLYGMSHAVCNVKGTNKRTLRLWRHMKLYIREKFGDRRMSINIIPNPFSDAYKMVTINLLDIDMPNMGDAVTKI